MDKTLTDLIAGEMDIEYECITSGGGIILRTKNLDVHLDEGAYSERKAVLLLEAAEKTTLLHNSGISLVVAAPLIATAMEGRIPAEVVSALVEDIYESIKPI